MPGWSPEVRSEATRESSPPVDVSHCRPERARAVFERAASFVNDVGLLAEEVDPISGELLGNFPQAFSHIGLVNAAWAICGAEAPSTA